MARVLGTILALALALVAASASAEQRVALIIGNGDYLHSLPKLANTTNDARAIDRALREVGFETTLKVNATRRETYAAIAAFSARIASGAVGLFYYAGHGVQANGHNYLIPVDADIATEDDLQSEAVDIGTVLKDMDDARNPMNIVILDACRDNPLPRGRSIARGLGRMDSPRGTFIAYAAAPGQTARDGPTGGNGTFTGELVKVLSQPGLKIEDVFKKVTAGVVSGTAGQQTPWTESSIQTDFYFRPPGPAATPGVAAAPAANDNAVELEFWKSIVNSNDAADFADYIKRYPAGEFASIARRKQQTLGAATTATQKSAPPQQQAMVVPPPPRPGPAAPPPSQGFRDCPDCPEMVMLPTGQFMLGTDAAETSREQVPQLAANWERPRHPVTVGHAFAIGRYPVTRGEYSRFVQATGYAVGSSCAVGTGSSWEAGNGKSWRNTGFAQTDRDPVVCIDWDDAKAYAAWLSRTTGKSYRLPTEAEWEYAARAGTTTARWWGDTLGSNHANCNGCGSAWDDRQTSPVDSFAANPFGLHDMLGNVWQWLEDCWTDSYANAPAEASIAITSTGDCARRVVRGGSWDSTPRNLRAGGRGRDAARDRNTKLGFRVVRSQ